MVVREVQGLTLGGRDLEAGVELCAVVRKGAVLPLETQGWLGLVQLGD